MQFLKSAFHAASVLMLVTAAARAEPSAPCSAAEVSGCGGQVEALWKQLESLRSGDTSLSGGAANGEAPASAEPSYVKTDGKLDAAIAMRRSCVLRLQSGGAPEACASSAAPVRPPDEAAVPASAPIVTAVAPSTDQPASASGDAVSAMPAHAKCMTAPEIAAAGDPDFQRNRDALSHPALCVTVEKVSDGPTTWTLEIVRNLRRPSGPLWAVPHDSEDDAFSTGAFAVLNYGGAMVTVEAGEARLTQDQDPDRNFGQRQAAGACPDQRSPGPNFTQAFMKHAKTRLVVALHNAPPSGDTAGMDRPASSETPFVAAENEKKARLNTSPKHLLRFAGRLPGAAPVVRKEAAWFNGEGINVSYETVTPESGSCSLSDYLTLRGGYRFFGIEAPQGATRDQIEMVKVVMKRMGIAASPSGNAPPVSLPGGAPPPLAGTTPPRPPPVRAATTAAPAPQAGETAPPRPATAPRIRPPASARPAAPAAAAPRDLRPVLPSQ